METMIKMTILDILRKMKQEGYAIEQILDYLGNHVVEAGITTSDSAWIRSISGSTHGIVLIERRDQ